MLEIVRQMTLRQRLLAIVAVAIIPASVALVYLIAHGHRQRELAINAEALRTSQITALEMERIVSGAEAVLRTLALTPAVRRPECSDYLALVDANLPQLSGFAVAGPDGVAICATGVIDTDALKQQPWFDEALGRDGFAVGTYTAAPERPVPAGRDRDRGGAAAGARDRDRPRMARRAPARAQPRRGQRR